MHAHPLPSPAVGATPTIQPTVPRRWGMALGLLLASAAVGGAAATIWPWPQAGAAGLTVLCIGLWATALVPEAWTALLFFLAAVGLGIAPAQTVFSGFHSSTFWLLFSGIVLGAAIRHTGLGARAAGLLARAIGRRYVGVIGGVVGFGLLLAFVMPSSIGRVVLLVPIAVALADQLGYPAGSNGRTGILAAVAFGTSLPAYAILPANGPNMILAGMAETLHGQQLGYASYLLLHFPVLGLLKALVLTALIVWLCPAGPPAPRLVTAAQPTAMTAVERRLAFVLALCLALWATDTLHHVSPGWVGLAAALFCLWPHSKLTPPNCLNSDLQYGPLFFVAGIMGLGAVIAATGLGESVMRVLIDHAHLMQGHLVRNLLILTALASAIGLATSLPGIPALLTPVAGELARVTGLPLNTVLMAQVLGFSNVALPFQAPPLVTGLQLAQLPIGPMTRLCLILFAVGWLVLLPLDLLWWRFLGML